MCLSQFLLQRHIEKIFLFAIQGKIKLEKWQMAKLGFSKYYGNYFHFTLNLKGAHGFYIAKETIKNKNRKAIYIYGMGENICRPHIQ